MWTAFPSADYYGHSVALGLAAGRRSRVRSDRTSERDTGPLFGPLSSLAGCRPPGGEFEQRNRYRPIPPAPPVHAVAMDVTFHLWSLIGGDSSSSAVTSRRSPSSSLSGSPMSRRAALRVVGGWALGLVGVVRTCLWTYSINVFGGCTT